MTVNATRYRYSFRLRNGDGLLPQREEIMGTEVSTEKLAMERIDDLKDAVGEVGAFVISEKLEEGHTEGEVFVSLRTILQ